MNYLTFICWVKEHDWVYSFSTYFGEALEKYYERWEERECQRCGKYQERKDFEANITRRFS